MKTPMELIQCILEKKEFPHEEVQYALAHDENLRQSSVMFGIYQDFSRFPITEEFLHAIYPDYDCCHQTLVIPEGITTIESVTLEALPFEKLRLPSSVQKIEENAFSHWMNLKELQIAEGSQLKELETGAFESCCRLNNVSLPDTIQKIGKYCFAHCESLQNISLNEKARFSISAFQDTMFLQQIKHGEIPCPKQIFHELSQREKAISCTVELAEKGSPAYQFLQNPENVFFAMEEAVLSSNALERCYNLFESIGNRDNANALASIMISATEYAQKFDVRLAILDYLHEQHPDWHKPPEERFKL